MKVWFQKNYKTIIISAFLIPIITVAVVSISHVTQWYGISNPFTWAIYLSVGVEIAALSSLAAISANMGKKIYFSFGIVTLIQFIGNIFFAYSFIDVSASSFKSWVELVSPLLEMTGVEPTDFIGHKRFLAFLSGGMLPLISLSFLHMLVKFSEEDKQVEDKKEEPEKFNASDLIGEISRIRLSEDDLALLEERLLKIKPKEEFEKLQKASLKDEVSLSDEEIMERAQKIEFKRIAERMKKIGEIQNEIRGYEDNSEDPVGALANSEYRLKEDDDDDELNKMRNDYFKRQAQHMKEVEEDNNLLILEKQAEALKKIESWESDEINLTDEEIDQAIAEFNELEKLEDYSPEPDEAWDIGVDPIDKDDEPIYQTDSKELDKMLDIVDDAIDEKKK
jgi:hypothetical protein